MKIQVFMATILEKLNNQIFRGTNQEKRKIYTKTQTKITGKRRKLDKWSQFDKVSYTFGERARQF